MILAKAIVTLYHDPEAANRAEDHFNRVFRDKAVPLELKTLSIGCLIPLKLVD